MTHFPARIKTGLPPRRRMARHAATGGKAGRDHRWGSRPPEPRGSGRICRPPEAPSPEPTRVRFAGGPPTNARHGPVPGGRGRAPPWRRRAAGGALLPGRRLRAVSRRSASARVVPLSGGDRGWPTSGPFLHRRLEDAGRAPPWHRIRSRPARQPCRYGVTDVPLDEWLRRVRASTATRAAAAARRSVVSGDGAVRDACGDGPVARTDLGENRPRRSGARDLRDLFP